MSNENSKGATDKRHTEMEVFATKLVDAWHGHLSKLKELASQIENVEKYFQSKVRGSVTLMGCSSFKEFCERQLRRDRTTVYAMLRNYKAEKDGKEKGDTSKGKGTGSNGPTLKQELAEAKAKVERLLPAGHAAAKFAEAVKAGHKAKKEEAQKELLFTVDASPAKGLNADNQPNTAMMLHELLAEIQRIGDRIFTVAPTLVRLANAQIKRLQSQGKIGFIEQEKPKPEAPKAEAPPDSNTDALKEMGAILDQAEQVNADIDKKIVGNFTVMKRGKKFVAFNHTLHSGGKNTLCVGTEKECVDAAEAASEKEKPQVQAAAGSAL